MFSVKFLWFLKADKMPQYFILGAGRSELEFMLGLKKRFLRKLTKKLFLDGY